MTREHPHLLPPDELDAFARQRALFNDAMNDRMRRNEPMLDAWPMPRRDYELIEQAMSHWPDWDPETGEPIVCHIIFVDADGRMLFTGVAAVIQDDV